MKRLELRIVYLICMLVSCTKLTASVFTNDKTQLYNCKAQKVDSIEKLNTPSYRIISEKETYTLQWTGKTFTGINKNKVDTKLISAILKGLNVKWLTHSLSISTKEVYLLKDSVQKDAMTIVALKSAETGWSIGTFDREYFMIDECKAPLYAVPYFIDGSVYVICMIPSFQITGNEALPIINRKALYEGCIEATYE
ncbi:hypothetical protein [Prevotella intermedia]|uniref:hypothetical protein n=1 Tax=Prevotella intermedia TaxID=28131 RepID=UPI00211B43F4|nr:hypothetical protein [Prevotella intermedia]